VHACGRPALVINERLKLWNMPSREQAGGQEGKGCLEQIMALRLLVDFVKGKRRKLFLVYVDFQKAYDRIPRYKLIERLKELGCRRIMLKPITSI